MKKNESGAKGEKKSPDGEEYEDFYTYISKWKWRKREGID